MTHQPKHNNIPNTRSGKEAASILQEKRHTPLPSVPSVQPNEPTGLGRFHLTGAEDATAERTLSEDVSQQALPERVLRPPGAMPQMWRAQADAQRSSRW